VAKEIMERPFCCIDRDSKPAGEHVKAPDMVTMLMRYQYSTNLPGIQGCPVHSQERLFRAQSCIQKERPALSLEKNAIAFAPAGKNSATHRPIIGVLVL
jgi:hypothetical protein